MCDATRVLVAVALAPDPHNDVVSGPCALYDAAPFNVTVSPGSAFFFFFNDTATPEISPLPLHDALPIYLAGELADRRQTRARRQLPVPHQLCDALADLIDQRLVRIAAQLEHLKPSASGSPHLSIMTAVVANARAMARVNARRPRGAASRPRSELPNSAQTVMHGTPMPSMIPAM